MSESRPMGQSVCPEGGQEKPAKAAPDYWIPSVGDEVWMNYPDFKEPEGIVVGFVTEGARSGQPIIERQRDEPAVGGFGCERKKGERVVIAPIFLLPFRYRGAEWMKAYEEGRVR